MASISDLTHRELEILHSVLSGKTNKAIAGEFRISERTVEFHLDNIFTKTGTRNRLMAAIWAMQQGVPAGPVEIPS